MMVSVTQARTITPTRLFIYVSHVVIQWVPKRVGVGGVGGGAHIVSSKKFLRISSSPHQTLPTDNYNAPEEVGGGRKLFHRPLKK